MKLLAALAALIFCGCAEDSEGVRTVTGEYLGQSAEVEIDPTAGRLLLPEGLLPTQSVIRETYSDRVIETYDLERSLVVLEIAWEGGFADYESDAQFQRLFANWEINTGYPSPSRWFRTARAASPLPSSATTRPVWRSPGQSASRS